MDELDLALRAKSKHEDMRRIIQSLLLDVTHFGQDLAGTEYKLSYFSEQVSVEAMREWVNWAAALQRQVTELGEILDEHR